MSSILKPIGHEDRLSVVDHLDELRKRLFVAAAVLLVAFGICFWQNHALLHLLNSNVPTNTHTAANHLGGLTKATVTASGFLRKVSGDLGRLAVSPTQKSADQALFSDASRNLDNAARALPQKDPPVLPVTLGVGEAFSTTLIIAAYFALLFSLPILLYQAYAFVLPALSPTEKRVALPMMIMAPVLFAAGVVFAFVMVLPPAVKFLQGFNSQSFDNLIQAKPLYTFEIFTMVGVGLAFQLPIGLLALQRVGVLTGSTLIRQWRYAVVGIAVIAAALPGPDPVTTALETVPLFILYGVSIVLLKLADRSAARRAERELAADLENLDGDTEL